MDSKFSEKVHDEILKDIVNGVYTARDFISEAQMAAKYGVSKAPVKEAMHILANEGFLVSYPKRGYMINTYTAEEINKIQDIRRVLESLALRNVIAKASDEEIRSLKFYNQTEKLQYSPKETVNTRFHMGLARLSGNEFIEETLHPLLIKASLYNIKGEPDTTNFDHIVDAILERNVDKAIDCLVEDIRYV